MVNGNYETLEDCEAVCQTSEIFEQITQNTNKLYPNPLINGSTITINPSERVILYNMLGKKVFEKELNNNFSFTLPYLNKGYYLMKTDEGIERVIIH